MVHFFCHYSIFFLFAHQVYLQQNRFRTKWQANKKQSRQEAFLNTSPGLLIC